MCLGAGPNAALTAVEIASATVRVAGAELGHLQRQVVDDALDVVLAHLERAEHLAPVARGRLEAPDRARQRARVAAQPLTADAEQDGQVVARVSVQRREDLVASR